MTLLCGAFGKFASFMNDDVEELYQFYIKSVPLYFVQDGFLGSRGRNLAEVSDTALV